MKKLVVVFIFCYMTSAFAAQQVVNVFNWGGYIPSKVLHLFRKQTGIKINYSTYDSNEVLYTKLKITPNAGYDVAVPSAPMVTRMAREGMLLKLDKTKLPNFKNLNPLLLNRTYDPDNQYSVPYLWGTTGILVNLKRYLPREINSWQDFWKPQFHGKLALTNDMRDMFAVALKVLGYSINDQNPAHIRQAYLKLKTLLPNVQSFEADGAEHLYINEDANVGMIESGDAQTVLEENSNFYYVYPKDGPIIWIDCMVIPVGAKHIANAYKFINFILRPDIAKMISKSVGFSTPNIAAFKLLPKSVQRNQVLNPTPADLARGNVEGDIGQKARKLYLNYWEQLKLGDA